MILGLGLDIVDISRIEKTYGKFEDNFLKKVFSSNEILKFNDFSNKVSRIKFLAKRFAAKEAFSKAIGTGIGKINFNEIEIYNDNNGKPGITKTNKVNKIIKDIFNIDNYQINISISDDANISQSIVIISKNND